MDPIRNFAKVDVSGGYNASASTITLASGMVAKLPDPATEGAFDLVWWNVTDFADPADDTAVEIVRVTAIAGNDITVTRAQQGTIASAKDIVGKNYQMVLSFTQASFESIVNSIESAGIGAGTLLDLDPSQQSDDAILYETIVKGGKLGTSNGVRITIPISSFKGDTIGSTFNLIYGATTLATFTTDFLDDETVDQKGFIQAVLFADTTAVAQKGMIQMLTGQNEASNGASAIGLAHGASYGTSTEDSTTDLALQVTCSSSDATIVAEGAIFEMLSGTVTGRGSASNTIIPFNAQDDNTYNYFREEDDAIYFFARTSPTAFVSKWRKDALTGEIYENQGNVSAINGGAIDENVVVNDDYILAPVRLSTGGLNRSTSIRVFDKSTLTLLATHLLDIAPNPNTQNYWSFGGELYIRSGTTYLKYTVTEAGATTGTAFTPITAFNNTLNVEVDGKMYSFNSTNDMKVYTLSGLTFTLESTFTPNYPGVAFLGASTSRPLVGCSTSLGDGTFNVGFNQRNYYFSGSSGKSFDTLVIKRFSTQ